MTIDELKAELIQERDERMAEKSEFDHKLAVVRPTFLPSHIFSLLTTF